MSQLVLVRHGQASLFADDYDNLSPLGETQARHLGQYWAKRGVTFDEVYTGTMRRQRQTADLVAAVYAEAGLPWSTPLVTDALDEYDAFGILREFVPLLHDRDPRVRALAKAYEQAMASPDRYRHFQRLTEAVIAHWVSGTVETPGIETWQSFYARVSGVWRSIIEREGSGRRVVAFSSGGPIAVAVQLAVNAPPTTAIELNWRIRNAALTEIIFTRDRLSLDTFNTVPHLDDPALVTYR